MILVIDNYDSFVYNLARYFVQLGQETVVFRNDKLTSGEIRGLQPDAIVLSPGPCTPDEAGICVDVVKSLGDIIPILGVCLGHQAIVAAMGGKIVRAAQPMHGQASEIQHTGNGLFAGIPQPMSVGRYHSLVADPLHLPDCLEVLAHGDADTIMAVSHREYPIYGVQFHPESVLTEFGYQLLANFLTESGLSSESIAPAIAETAHSAWSTQP